MKFLSNVWEPARDPGTAVPYALREQMGIADPLHPNIPKGEQFHGELPGEKAGARHRRRGVLNPSAPVTAMSGIMAGKDTPSLNAPATGTGGAKLPPAHTRTAKVQGEIELSVGVISRMVMEAARGKKAYAKAKGVPPDLAKAMEAFVRAAKLTAKGKEVHTPADLAALQGALSAQLKAFFMSLK